MLADKQVGEFTPEDEAILLQLAQIASVSVENAARAKAQTESEARLRANQVHANIGKIDVSGRIISINTGFSAIAGYPREELLSLSVFDLTHLEEGEAERTLYEMLVRARLRGTASGPA